METQILQLFSAFVNVSDNVGKKENISLKAFGA